MEKEDNEEFPHWVCPMVYDMVQIREGRYLLLDPLIGTKEDEADILQHIHHMKSLPKDKKDEDEDLAKCSDCPYPAGESRD